MKELFEKLENGSSLAAEIINYDGGVLLLNVPEFNCKVSMFNASKGRIQGSTVDSYVGNISHQENVMVCVFCEGVLSKKA